LHYEGAIFHAGWVDGGRTSSDIVCPMYSPIDAVRAYGERRAGSRPLIMCEYSHAMGNSNGSLADYWDVISSTPGLQGGFIWEWKDHGLLARLPNGKRGFAYGGQFGDVPNDGNFVADGLMSADLIPHPAMQEVAWVHRPVVVALGADRRSLAVTNRRSFTGLADLRATWELLVAGDVVDSGSFDPGEIAPLSSVEVPLPCLVPDHPDAHLTVPWYQRRPTAWAPKDHLVAWDQLTFTLATPPPTETSRNPDAERPDSAKFEGEGGIPAVELCLFRAPVDNDGLKLLPDLGKSIGVGAETLLRWRDAGIDHLDADALVDHRHTVESLADGSQLHHHVVEVPGSLDDLPRIGVTFELPAGFDRLRWYGRGPLENYPDRNRGAVLGTWEASVDDPPYLVPQDFGLRTDCRWFEFVNSSSRETGRLDVVAPGAMHISATHFTARDLYAAGHETDLRPRRSLIVHADVAHRGLGTASCGPDVLDRYRIRPGTYRFSYRLSSTS
jgi:beta-galactosidase